MSSRFLFVLALFFFSVRFTSAAPRTKITPHHPEHTALHHPGHTAPHYPLHTAFPSYHPSGTFQCKHDWFKVRARRANTQWSSGTLGYIHFHYHDARLISKWKTAARFTLHDKKLVSEHNHKLVGAEHRGVALLERHTKEPRIGGDWNVAANGVMSLPDASFCWKSASRDIFVVTDAAVPKDCSPIELVAECCKSIERRFSIPDNLANLAT